MPDHEFTIEQRFETLKAHVETLPAETINAYRDKVNETPHILIDWTNEGNAVAVYIGASKNPDALTKTDFMGRTALHHAAKDQSGLLARILTEKPNAAPFAQDVEGKTPLDHAGSQQNTTMQTLLFPLTYPDLFIQPVIAKSIADDHLNTQNKTYAKKRRDFVELGATQKQRDKERDI